MNLVRNYLKMAWRLMQRNKLFSLINIFGLAIGLATCLLIVSYIADESKVDRHHKDGSRIFRIASIANGQESWASLPAPVASAIREEMPEAEEVTRLLTFPEINPMALKNGMDPGNEKFLEPNGYYVDSDFFETLSYDFIYGNPEHAMDHPNSIVLSSSTSVKLFGNTNPVGKTVIVSTPMGDQSYSVNGVFNSTRYPSHIPAHYFMSMQNQDMWQWVKNQESWTTNNIFFTYVKIRKGTDSRNFEKKLDALLQRHAGEKMKAAGFSKSLFLQPVDQIYLHSSLGNEISANGNINLLYVLGSIAFFILLIACINFMNLSTARSEHRAREVGVRKVMGASRSSLIRQFLGESFLTCLLSLLLALVLAKLALPVFNQLAGKQLQLFSSLPQVAFIAALCLLTGLLAGLYPAIYLSGFRPVSILKGKIINHLSATAIRKGLVIFQFSISVCLILGTLIIWQQLNFLQKQDLGFKKEQQLVLPLRFENTESNYTALKNSLLTKFQVRSVTSGSAYPGIPDINDMIFYPEGKAANEVTDIQLFVVNKDYLETLGIKLMAGRAFQNGFADSASIILNETAIRELGYDIDHAVGRKIFYDFNGQHHELNIVGVVKDFNFESLHSRIRPFGFSTSFFANKFNFVIASVSTKEYPAFIRDIKKAWKSILPAAPFEYSFLDQDFQKNYQKEQVTSSLVLYFTIVAILIACLGLFGLSMYSAERRMREIGIRKVLGASMTSVIALLTKEFLKPVLFGMLIAFPAGWWFMNRWLQQFAYQVKIGWWVFGIAMIFVFLISALTVSFQAIRSARANPVDSIKVE